ncbi:hypothetical protein OBBRIDRAFT_833997 [Obba rivulosa]|uniref:Uncharacterized protein n=1 Tax=Obba rivulosa TaxID=1052685 RepID=A0A8E2AYV6_9APHY|nr:hypothetical protein OBBRIDRAFT_833997 [Obba rivulosa]
MDAALSRLQQLALEHPENMTLQRTIRHLSQLAEPTRQSTNPGSAETVTWDVLRGDFHVLREEGLWDASAESDALLAELRASFSSQAFTETSDMSADHSSSRISIIAPPLPSTPLLSSISNSAAILPVELVDALNHTYFLHLLATDPEKILPPGKSLLSMMVRPHAQKPDGAVPSLKDRVTDIVQRAFWDEALETLSSLEPPVQLPRLKRLYEDLHTALKPLLPPDHPVLVTLSSPLSPTSFPLRSAINHLREIVVALRERCAPTRDAHIDELLRPLDDVPPPSNDIPTSASIPALAKLVVDSVRGILHLADIMKDDLSQFVLGAMSEAQLRAAIRTQARSRERELILQLWSSSRVQEEWQSWLAQLNSPSTSGSDNDRRRLSWISRLVQALGSTSPVSCIPPSTAASIPVASSEADQEFRPGANGSTTATPNRLPPPLFFACPTLLYLQNYLQALVIAASLRSLVRLPLSGGDAASNNPHTDFTGRIWALLKAEVDETPDSGDTKLINLADEVIRVRQLCAGKLDAEEEQTLRAAVDRTLRPTDPVFVLLQRRLMDSIADHVVEGHKKQEIRNAPMSLQTGRAVTLERPGKRPRLMVTLGDEDVDAGKSNPHEVLLKVKGFEDPILTGALDEALRRLEGCIEWVQKEWPDLTARGDIAADVEHLEEHLAT